MTAREFASLAAGCFAAWLGYILFDQLGFPAAALTGAAAAATAACLSGLDFRFPILLRNAVILLLGINIGTGVTPEVLSGAAQWPVSLMILVACVLASMAAGAAMLVRLFGFDRDTALLAAVPGHLSYVLSIAAESGRNIQAVAVLQSVRVLIVTLCVPPVVVVAFGATGITVLPEEVTRPVHLVAIVLAAIPAAVLLTRLNVPAAFLLSGMVMSALGHGSDLTPGRLPDSLGTGALILMGALIGSRFSATSPRLLLSYILPGLCITLVAMGFAVIGVILTALLLGLAPGLLVVAFTPGGVEAMAAIALALGYDPAFVAAHHVVRLAALTLVMPYLFRGVRAN